MPALDNDDGVEFLALGPRFSAASGLLAGLFLAVAGFASIFTGKTAGAAFAIVLAPALAIPLLVAVYHQRHADVPGVFRPVAYATNLIGLGPVRRCRVHHRHGAVLPRRPGPRPPQARADHRRALGSAVVFAVGSVLFGAFLLRSRAYPRPLCWAYIVFPALLAVLSPLPDSPVKNVIHFLAGATLAWLAVTLWRTNGRPAPHSRPVRGKARIAAD